MRIATPEMQMQYTKTFSWRFHAFISYNGDSKINICFESMCEKHVTHNDSFHYQGNFLKNWKYFLDMLQQYADFKYIAHAAIKINLIRYCIKLLRHYIGLLRYY